MDKISILKNSVQEYAWGSRTEIQNIIGDPGSLGKPMAELWMGAHPKAPSQVMVDGEWLCLDKAIAKDPESILGKRVAERFSNQLPFLFKVLAAERPLSVQVHPNKKQAQQGVERENLMAIPLDAANRNYKDNNHKPEILCALKPFHGLIGFRPIEEILELLAKLGIPSLADEITLLTNRPDWHGLRLFFSALLCMEVSVRHEAIKQAVTAAEKYRDVEPAFSWIVELYREYPGDIGVLSPAICNLVRLEPGEAIYVPAGLPHAYLRGLGIELMANSDNVLRGGLTPKQVNVNEFLNVVEFHSGHVRKVEKVSNDVCQFIYKTPAKEFELSLISVDKKCTFTSAMNRSAEVIICLKGMADIIDIVSGQRLAVSQGISFLVPAIVSRYRIEGCATLYRASVPDWHL
ncbi:Mannose-6-phosphate isomerase, class I [uncultured Desulfobacterium sp.]|uniref:mannose-6-phosphate isomerase n=1 Tax=uncultured Desulfobacterium sp. TaxID=201089 RepID=A0A445MW23_9BACT|nr:Mannose-6-phosphate isomerase, class I [uncultured Desulfobacterium sp.]